MTPEERFEQIETNLQSVSANLQSVSARLDTLTKIHLDNDHESRERFDQLAATHADFEKKMTGYAADVKDAIRRLANIAEAHGIQLDDHDKRLDDLEDN